MHITWRRSVIRGGLIATLGLFALGAPASAQDSVADMMQPSSTVPGCVNDWQSGDPRANEQTCEGKAEAQRWTERVAAINTAHAVISRASMLPERADNQEIIDALGTLAAAADASVGNYHPPQLAPNSLAATLLWMQRQFDNMKLPVPASLGDGYRTLAGILASPATSRNDRAATYDRAAVMASALSEAVQESMNEAAREVDAAVRSAHVAAVRAAQAAMRGHYPNGAAGNPPVDSADAQIRAAAGPHQVTIAQGQTTRLNQSLAAHPDQGAYSVRLWRTLRAIPGNMAVIAGICLMIALAAFRRASAIFGPRATIIGSVALVVSAPLSILPLGLGFLAFGYDPDGSLDATGFLIWFAVFGVLFVVCIRFFARRIGGPSAASTHGTARFANAKEMAPHLAPAAPADAFALGWVRGAPKGADARFRQDGHVLTCAPTGAGKGLSAVIPNLLDYPGSAFVLDFKGENYAVTARARREAGHTVFLVDPFGITKAPCHAMNWLDALNPDDPDVVGLAGSLADMLVVPTGAESDPHWNDTARELLRGLLIYVAGLEGERRTMGELRRIITSSDDELAEVLADMISDPTRGQRIVARAATAFVNRPEKERASVLSTAVRHTAWLDDPRLEAVLSRSDFDLRDLKRRKVTLYVAIPPDRMRACLGFMRGLIGLALNAMSAVEGKPAARVAFFLDEFGQLGRMDAIADNITILRGYGVQFWLFVQDLSQLKAVYPRWQSFMANTTQQYFGTADYDTAKHISDILGHHTIQFSTSSSSSQTGFGKAAGGGSISTGEHLHGRSLLTPDEVRTLDRSRTIVMVAGENPFLLDRLSYLADFPYGGRFDVNPMHTQGIAAQ